MNLIKESTQDFCAIVKCYATIVLSFLLVQKPLFLLLNPGHGLTLSDIWQIYHHGLALDLAATSYLAALPALLIIIRIFCQKVADWVRTTLRYYNLLIALILSVVAVVDASLYEFWEFKLDNTVFFYITDPQNAAASVSLWYIIWHLALILALWLGFFKALQWAVRPAKQGGNSPQSASRCVVKGVVSLLLMALIFAGARGIDIWPNTPSKAYHSSVTFHNHAAVNPLFNMVYSLTHRGIFRKEMRFYSDEEVNALVPPLFPTEGKAECLLTTQRPNILYIVIEGMGSLFIDALDSPDESVASHTGELPREVAPHLSRLMQEGVCFTQCYCGSFRTDRGIVCAVSGYLGQPTASIMRYSRKVASLPGLPKTLRLAGYDTQVLYASDITYFNMADYFLASGHDRLISQDNFPASERTTKWGVPDEVACQWLAKDIISRSAMKQPFYTTFLTVSSHTPFDVPYHRMKDEQFNGFAYTDQCIGDLIATLKASPAWDNLLVVITADHGYNHREQASAHFPLIPFLMTGGAVKENRRVDYPVSQTDIPATLLGQLGLSHSDFPFSRDVLADTYTYPFAFNTFNNGFNLRDSTGMTVFDNVQLRAISGPDERRQQIGKSILQYLYNDLDAR